MLQKNELFKYTGGKNAEKRELSNVGARVELHPPNTVQHPYNNGFFVSAGQTTSVGVTMVMINKMICVLVLFFGCVACCLKFGSRDFYSKAILFL